MSFDITSFYRQSNSLPLLRGGVFPFLSSVFGLVPIGACTEMIQLDKSASD